MIKISHLGLKIIEYSVKATWKKFERNHRRVRVLKDFNIIELKDNYTYKYAFTLSEYGMDKQPAELVKLFAHDDVFNALKNERYNHKNNAFRIALEARLTTGGYHDLKKKFETIESLEPEIKNFLEIYDYYENQSNSPFLLRKFNEVQESINKLLEENIRKSFDYQADQYMQHLTENFYDELYKKLELDRKENSKLKDYFHKNFNKQDLYVDLNGETRTWKKEHPDKGELTARHDIKDKELKKEKEYDIIPHEPINNYITEWLNDDNRKFLAILGEYGTGKTTLCGFIAYQLTTGRLECNKDLRINDSLKRIPILFPLRNFREELIDDYIISQLNRFGIKDISYLEFLDKVKSGEFVILFDGFDEMAAKTDKAGQRINFDKLKSLIEHSTKSKILLTSRLEYFRSDEEQEYVLQSDASNIIFLKTFNKHQIDRYIKPRSTQPKQLKRQIEDTYDLEDLEKRAVLLEMIVKYLPKIARKHKVGESILASQLYSFAIEDELMRKIKECGWKTSVKTIRLEILEKIALLMYLKDKLTMTIPEIREELKQFPYYKQKLDYEIENDLTAFLTFTFLLRETDQRYRISHKSFRDFLVAQELVKEINNQNTEYFGKARLTDEVIHFINEQVLDYSKLNTITQQANNLGKENKWMGTNIVNIIIKDEEESLKGLQLQNCYVEGIDFTRCNLEQTNFSSVAFKDCSFDKNIFKAKLSKTDFMGSSVDLSFSRLIQIPPLQKLKNLTTLYLSHNQISDIRPLKELKNLTTLNLSDNQISDTSPLKELKNLTTLWLDRNQKSDIYLQGLKLQGVELKFEDRYLIPSH
ncbi:MAG: leucine-rich repeat domain-containing protein [Bacteroidales bacterium]|nr:leucine-rich repeat domain-containing protein [Bacteroidales bacterium]